MDKGFGATKDHVINVLHVSGIDHTPPRREFTPSSTKHDWYSDYQENLPRRLCARVFAHLHLRRWDPQGGEKKKHRERWKFEDIYLFFSPLNSISTTGMKSYKFDFTLYFVFSLSGTSSAGGENTSGKHTLPEQILLNLSPQVCLWHLQNQLWGASLPQGTHNNVLRISFLDTRGGTGRPLCPKRRGGLSVFVWHPWNGPPSLLVSEPDVQRPPTSKCRTIDTHA